MEFRIIIQCYSFSQWTIFKNCFINVLGLWPLIHTDENKKCSNPTLVTLSQQECPDSPCQSASCQTTCRTACQNKCLHEDGCVGINYSRVYNTQRDQDFCGLCNNHDFIDTGALGFKFYGSGMKIFHYFNEYTH